MLSFIDCRTLLPRDAMTLIRRLFKITATFAKSTMSHTLALRTIRWLRRRFGRWRGSNVEQAKNSDKSVHHISVCAVSSDQ
jgi:hypothetical protein